VIRLRSGADDAMTRRKRRLVPEPAGKPAPGRVPSLFRGRKALTCDVLVPPLGALLRLVRLIMTVRFRGFGTIPASPWPLLHGTVAAAASAAALHFLVPQTKLLALLTAGAARLAAFDEQAGLQAQAAAAVRWKAWLWTAAAKTCAGGAWALDSVAPHHAMLHLVLTVYAAGLACVLALHAADRLRTRHQWRLCRNTILAVHGRPAAPGTGAHLGHHALNLFHLLLTVVLAAWAWAPQEPALSALCRRPVVPPLVDLWTVAGLAALLLWVGTVLFIRARPFLRDGAIEEWSPPAAATAALPSLTVDGAVPIPQLPAISPLWAETCNLDGLGRRGADARRFATLYCRGMDVGCRYESGANVAGPSAWALSTMAAAPDSEWWKADAPVEHEEFTLPRPKELVTILCRLMYVAAALDGRISRQANAVIRGFCLDHNLSRLVTEEELAELIKGLAAEDWRIPSPEDAVARVRNELEPLGILPTLGEYMSAWFKFTKGAGVRHGSGEFDPLRNGRFQDVEMGFPELALLLMQAIVYADRRINQAESGFVKELHLDGDFESILTGGADEAETTAEAGTSEDVQTADSGAGGEP
jgi:hypothetical protein